SFDNVVRRVSQPSSQCSSISCLDAASSLNSESLSLDSFSPSEVRKSDHLEIMLPLKCFMMTAMLFDASFIDQCSCESSSCSIVLSPSALTSLNFSMTVFKYLFSIFILKSP